MIVLVNDDGIDAPGLRALYSALRNQLQCPVLVVAPLHEKSGQGHAITLDRPLVTTVRMSDGFFGFAIDGTPADCTKIALSTLCPQPPQLVVSGINNGANVGRSILYSGTLGAALEAAVLGFPALAISRKTGEGSFSAAADFAAQIAARMIGHHQWAGRVVNCNVPGTPSVQWLDTRMCRHGQSGFVETYQPIRDAQERTVWNIHGEWGSRTDESEYDAALLQAGHPTVTVLVPNLNDEHTSAAQLLPEKYLAAP